MGKETGDRLGRRPQPAMLLISPVTVLAKTTYHGGAAIRSSRAFTRRRSSEAIANVAAGGIAWLIAAGAFAQTDEIQVYDATINAPGQFSLELHNNYTPIGRKQPDFEGGITPNHTLNGVPEWAYGVTDWLELGLYLPLYSWTGTRHFLIDGAKLRAEFVVPHAQQRSFFTASISNSASMPFTGSRPARRGRSGR